jgi:hypothetical protein
MTFTNSERSKHFCDRDAFPIRPGQQPGSASNPARRHPRSAAAQGPLPAGGRAIRRAGDRSGLHGSGQTVKRSAAGLIARAQTWRLGIALAPARRPHRMVAAVGSARATRRAGIEWLGHERGGARGTRTAQLISGRREAWTYVRAIRLPCQNNHLSTNLFRAGKFTVPAWSLPVPRQRGGSAGRKRQSLAAPQAPVAWDVRKGARRSSARGRSRRRRPLVTYCTAVRHGPAAKVIEARCGGGAGAHFRSHGARRNLAPILLSCDLADSRFC